MVFSDEATNESLFKIICKIPFGRCKAAGRGCTGVEDIVELTPPPVDICGVKATNGEVVVATVTAVADAITPITVGLEIMTEADNTVDVARLVAITAATEVVLADIVGGVDRIAITSAVKASGIIGGAFTLIGVGADEMENNKIIIMGNRK